MINFFKITKNFLLKNNSQKQTVMKNTFWLTASEITSRLLRFGLIIYIARILGAEGWGLFSYTLSLIGISLVISDGGSSLFFTKEYTEKRGQYIKTILLLKFSLLIATTLLALIVGFFFASLPVSSLIIPVIIILVSDSIRDFLNTFFRVQEKMEKEAFIKIITNVILIVSSIILISIYKTPESLALGYLIGSISGTLLALIMNISFIRQLKKITRETENKKIYIGRVLEFVIPITLTSIVGTIMLHIDTLMLGIWSDAEQVGLYAVAQRILQFSFIIPTLFITALYPTLAKIYTENKENFIVFTKKITTLLFILGTPVAFGGCILGTPLLTTLFGSEYTLSGPAFSWLIIGTFFIFPGFLFQILAIITEQQKKLALNICIIICVTIILNAILIPSYGIIGAAIGTTISQIGLFFLNRNLFKEIVLLNNKNTRDIFIATLIMILAISFLKEIQVLILIALGAIIYGGILFLLKNQTLFSIIDILKQKTP